MVRSEPTAEASFAAIRDLRRFGIAIAAMIRMIATTISNSIREKPFCFFMMLDLLDNFYDARARYTYRKPETNAAAEVIVRYFCCSTLILNRLQELRRVSWRHPSAHKWTEIVDLALFCPSPKAQIVTAHNDPSAAAMWFSRRVNPTGCASWHSDGRSGN